MSDFDREWKPRASPESCHFGEAFRATCNLCVSECFARALWQAWYREQETGRGRRP